MVRLIFGWSLALALGWAVNGHATVPITDCDQTVPAGQQGVLQGDIECEYRCRSNPAILCGYDGDRFCPDGEGCDAPVLILERGAVLNLNGHEVSPGFHRPAIICGSGDGPGRCTIRGPGKVWSSRVDAILSWQMDVVVKNLTLDGDGSNAVRTSGRVTMADTDILGGFDYGIWSGPGLKLVNVRASGAEEFTSTTDIELDNVHLGSGHTDVTARGNVRGRDVVLHGPVTIRGRNVALRRATSVAVPGFDPSGAVVADRRLKLVDSSVTYIGAGREPRLVRSACDQSFVVDTEVHWGVCASD